MKINLLQIIKNLPSSNVENFGSMVLFSDIYTYLKIHYNFDNHDILRASLRKLSDENLLELHELDELIIGVSVK